MKERERSTLEQCAIIHLFREGTFYRAYEWSAWLCCRYIAQFKATKREIKGETGETVVYIGFPITSLGKFLPEDAQMQANDDKSVAVTLPISVQDGEDGESLRNAFGHWKESVPLSPSRKGPVRDDLKNSHDVQPLRMSEIMFRVLAFPIEQKTPMECMNFIAELKQDIAKLL